MKKVMLFMLCFQSICAFSQQWLGSSTPYGLVYRADRVKVGYGPLYLDWTYQLNWNGNAQQWAGHIGFNSWRLNNDPKDYFYGENPYTSKGVFEGSNAGFRWLFRNVTENNSHLQHHLPELMILTSAGNLGIGTSNPDFKLTVNGKIKAEEIQVVVDVPADYVFDTDYKLKSLDELESYVREHKHLPGIPSAEEIKTDGWRVGEMNNKLLEKIEEITLYLIELKRENEELRKRMIELELRK